MELDLQTAANNAKAILNHFKSLQHIEAVILAAANAERIGKESAERAANLQAKANDLAAQFEKAMLFNEQRIASAKAEADEIEKASKARLEEANNKALAIVKEAEEKASARIKEAAATVDNWGQKLEDVTKAVLTKEDEVKALDAKITESRAVIAKMLGE